MYTSVGSLSSTGGIVQVCVNQQFVYICADGWDSREADVVCRSQGYEVPFYGTYPLRAPSFLLLVSYYNMIIFLFAESTASTTSMVFTGAPVYRYSMCNGTEYSFAMCQLPVPDSESMCRSFAAVNCTEGLSAWIVLVMTAVTVLVYKAGITNEIFTLNNYDAWLMHE